MASHRVTPYELTARDKSARHQAPDLLLSAMGAESVDLLDAVEATIRDVGAVSKKHEWSLACDRVRRDSDVVTMVFATDISGEVEVVSDGDGVVFVKTRENVARFYSLCSLWRPAEGTRGGLLVHSPWGRGGSRSNIVKLLQRTINQAKVAATLRAVPLIPAELLDHWLQNANATRIVYKKDKSISSTFDDSLGTNSTIAEMDLVVRGSKTAAFRKSLRSALVSSAEPDDLFAVQLRNEKTGELYTETFDDVSIDLETPGGSKRYSVKNETIPTASFNKTAEFNELYFDLKEEEKEVWSKKILEAGFPLMNALIDEVRSSL